MRRYFNREDFICFINLLEENKPTKLFIEDVEDNSVEEWSFMKMKFVGKEIILYTCPSAPLISDIQSIDEDSWVEDVEETFEDLECDGDYKLFIESD